MALVAAAMASLLVAAQSSASTIGAVAPPGAANTCSACWQVQDSTHDGGASYTIPFTGVATSFSVRAGSFVADGDSVGLYVFQHNGPGMFVTTGVTNTKPLPPSSAGQIVTFPITMPVVAGNVIGLAFGGPGGGNTAIVYDDGSNTSSDVVRYFGSPPALGTWNGTTAVPGTYHLNIEATIESDADQDGYGDVTQDLCSTDPTRQTACALVDAFPPVITHLKTTYKRFRFKHKGAVVSKRAHPGTTISLNLSEPASIAFTVEKAFRGKITKGVCKKAGRSNRKGRRCTKYIFVHAFSRAANTGVNTYPYSARYFDAKDRVGTLRPGPYRLTAVPTDGAGNVGAADSAAFKVRR